MAPNQHWFDKFVAFAQTAQIAIEYNVSLKEKTTFRLGGACSVFAKPDTFEKIALLQQYVISQAIPHFILGGGSNLLIADSGFAGVVVSMALPESIEILEPREQKIRIEIPASNRAPWTAKQVSQMGYTGLEFLTTIPGDFGGSIIQNAGCYGYELKDTLISVKAAVNGKIETLSRTDCAFSYRNSLFKKQPHIWVISAMLEIEAGKPEEIAARISDFKERRLASQPKNRRSAGSVYKNPANYSKKAWQLIDEAGLRGISIGDAEISPEHCNFIVNRGHATAHDVYQLMLLIEKTVFEKSAIQLEREVVLVGF